MSTMEFPDFTVYQELDIDDARPTIIEGLLDDPEQALKELEAIAGDPEIISDFEEFIAERASGTGTTLDELAYDDEALAKGPAQDNEDRKESRGEIPLDDPLLIYVRSMGDERILTRDEERELAIRKDAGDAAAKQALIERNLRLVMSIARQNANRGIPLLDLIQEGNLGLIHAIEKFDWRKGYKLSTYATWWIRQSMQKIFYEQGRAVRLTHHVDQYIKTMEKSIHQLRQTLKREPTTAEIARESGLPLRKVNMLLGLIAVPLSLDEPIGDGESTYGHVLEDTSDIRDPVAVTEKEALKSALATAVQSLPEKERVIIELRFGLTGDEPKTLDQIAPIFEITRERVRQIEARGLKLLAQLEGLEEWAQGGNGGTNRLNGQVLGQGS